MKARRLHWKVALILSVAASARSQQLIHVSPAGNPGWSGALAGPNDDKTDGPLDSLQSALQKMRDLKASGKAAPGGYQIILRGGRYELSEPVRILPEDSGTPDSPLVIRAREGERPVLSGGKIITGWTKEGTHLWKATPKLGYFRQLFSNGRRLTRARTPNKEFYHVSGRVVDDKTDARNNRSFRFDGDNLRNWGDPDVEVVAIHSWETSRLRIAAVHEGEKTVEFAGSAHWPFTSWDERQRYYVENQAEFVDEAGEWHLARSSGEVSYWADRTEDAASEDIIAPQIPQLLILAGDSEKGEFVSHVKIDGIAFQHCDWEMPETGLANAQGAVSVSGAVELHGARNCVIKNCEIAHVGTYGLRLRKGSSHNQITGNHIHDLGAGGVGIGETFIAQRPEDATNHNIIHNNYIHDGGHVCESGEGVWLGQASDNTISNNEISDFGYTGVSMGWTWGYGESASQRNIVEYNHIHHIGNGILSDMGGIYTLGFSAGSILRNNHIHHVTSYHYGGWGIYPDEGTSHMLIENNVVHHTKTGGFHQHYGKENFVRNNIFAFSQEAQLMRSREEEHRSFRFERNIVWFDEGYLLGSNWSNGQFFMDFNMYGCAPSAELEFKGMTFAEWKSKTGMDAHSIVGDPGFLDPAHDDYRLAADSPAFALGFQPIDMAEIGLVGPAEWRAMPSHPRRVRQTRPEPPVPTEVAEDFEAIAPGQTVPYGTSYGMTDGATIQVTDERAAEGKHSLRFTDAPGLDREFNPHYYHDPGFRAGRIRGSFDLLLEEGAIFYHEWRTEGTAYHAGPTLWIGGDGALKVGGESREPLPRGEWIHFEMTSSVGGAADGSYDVAVTLADGERRSYLNVACDPGFRALRWVGFCSMAVETRSFWIDNLRLEIIEN